MIKINKEPSVFKSQAISLNYENMSLQVQMDVVKF